MNLLLANVVTILCVVMAGIVMACGRDGWGWLLLIAVLAMHVSDSEKKKDKDVDA